MRVVLCFAVLNTRSCGLFNVSSRVCARVIVLVFVYEVRTSVFVRARVLHVCWWARLSVLHAIW